MRGPQWETVAIAQPYGSLPLSRMVTGDSATQLALRYERNARASGVMKLVADATWLAGAITIASRGRPGSERGHVSAVGLRLAVAGSVLRVSSIPLGLRARRAARQAVVLHNSALRE